jgi:hypothetical protein
MSGHVLFGVDLGELEDGKFYELEDELDSTAVELLPYFIGTEIIAFIPGTKVDADYGSLVTELPKLEVSDEKIKAFKDECAKLGFENVEPKWVVTFVGNE